MTTVKMLEEQIARINDEIGGCLLISATQSRKDQIPYLKKLKTELESQLMKIVQSEQR